MKKLLIILMLLCSLFPATKLEKNLKRAIQHSYFVRVKRKDNPILRTSKLVNIRIIYWNVKKRKANYFLINSHQASKLFDKGQDRLINKLLFKARLKAIKYWVKKSKRTRSWMKTIK